MRLSTAVMDAVMIPFLQHYCSSVDLAITASLAFCAASFLYSVLLSNHISPWSPFSPSHGAYGNVIMNYYANLTVNHYGNATLTHCQTGRERAQKPCAFFFFFALSIKSYSTFLHIQSIMKYQRCLFCLVI